MSTRTRFEKEAKGNSEMAYLRFISKATEKVVAATLDSYLDNNLHELLQSAYKQRQYGNNASDILRSIDERKCVALLLLDLSAAFDTVDHSILLSGLRHRFGIDGKVGKQHSYFY